MLGSTVAQVVTALDQAGADILGSNCGNGIAEMAGVARQMRALTKKPLSIKANAGLPRMVGDHA